MKNKTITTTALAITMLISCGAYARADALEAPAPTPTPVASVATTAPAPVQTTAPTPPAPVQTTAPTSGYAPGMAPGEHAGWAIVNPQTGQVSGGVIVCTPEVCGSGWFAGMRVVLQTLQDPVEAANSKNGVGNVAGHSGGKYNFETGKWTIPGPNNSVYQIPLAYPGADRGGNVNVPFCVENCPKPTPKPEPTPEPTLGPTPEPMPTDEPSPEPSPSETEPPTTPVADEDEDVLMQERRVTVKPLIVNNSVVINKKLNDKIFRNQVLIVATNGNKKMVWTQRVSGKIVNIKIARKYLFWNISIRYSVA